MKILVDKMPLDPTECLFYSAEEGEGNCVIGTKFESVKEHKGYCRCTVKDRKACPYLQERSQSDMKRDNEVDCYTYEREQKKNYREEIYKCAKQLDEAIRKQFHPDYSEEEDQTDLQDLHRYTLWLKNDVETILSDTSLVPDKDLEQTKTDIFKMIADSQHGDTLMNKYDVNEEKIMAAVSVKRDFLSALENAKCGSDLASKLGYTFSKNDLCKLAQIHKSGRYREKIEDMLTAANFHSECSLLCSGQYDKLINNAE